MSRSVLHTELSFVCSRGQDLTRPFFKGASSDMVAVYVNVFDAVVYGVVLESVWMQARPFGVPRFVYSAILMLRVFGKSADAFS